MPARPTGYRKRQPSFPTRVRQLQFESLEARRVLTGDVIDLGDFTLTPPPDSYLAPNLDLYVSRLTWEFDGYSNSPPSNGQDFISEDNRVLLDDGRAYLTLRAEPDDEQALRGALETLSAEVTGVSTTKLFFFAAAWVPLSSLDELAEIESLSRAFIRHNLRVNHSDAGPDETVIDLTSSSYLVGLPRNLDSTLGQIAVASSEMSESELESIFDRGLPGMASRSVLWVEDSRILVSAVSTNVSGENLRDQMLSLGIDLEPTRVNNRGVYAWVGLSDIHELSKLDDLSMATVAWRPILHAGSTTTQGDTSLKTDAIRDAFGFEGQGISVGVISDSYNVLGGAAADIASGDLPATVNVLAEGMSSGSDEGRAMLQIVHDVAPAADLLFATAGGSQQDFEDNILALANAGADVIVDDILFLNEPMFMDGPIAEAVDTVTSQGVTYVSAVGNFGSNSYQNSGFRPSATSVNYGLGPLAVHDFAPGPVDDPFMSITVPANREAFISLQWEDPFGSLTSLSPSNNLDLLVLIAANDEPEKGSGLFSGVCLCGSPTWSHG